jgi:hypothetical protein
VESACLHNVTWDQVSPYCLPLPLFSCLARVHLHSGGTACSEVHRLCQDWLLMTCSVCRENRNARAYTTLVFFALACIFFPLFTTKPQQACCFWMDQQCYSRDSSSSPPHTIYKPRLATQGDFDKAMHNSCIYVLVLN